MTRRDSQYRESRAPKAAVHPPFEGLDGLSNAVAEAEARQPMFYAMSLVGTVDSNRQF